MPERIGKYEIRGELGKGGFGQVFLGFDPTVGRQVAIKVLSSEGDPNGVRRFRTEASAAGNLHHKNIVTIHELGEDHGTFYMAMEYLEGRDLQHLISSTDALSLLDKVRIMSQTAEGLLCAHQNGIVHRDVKPANIMVLADGSVKLMDFGIARLTRDRSTRLTETGFLVGSVFYMAPEQLNGRDVDARCDIWAYGTIYYELLCGRHPFDARDVASAMFLIMQHEPSPIQVVWPECPDALAAVLTRLLLKDRDARYQSFEEILFDTAPILLDLESRQAEQLASQAMDLLRKGNLDEVQSIVKRILAYDPAHEQGRALWQQLQAESRHRSARLRTQSLIEQSEKASAARDFKTAIEALESAVRIDPADASLPVRLAELHAAKQRSDLATPLVLSARENLQSNNLSSAFQLLGDALNAEPGNAEAQRLLSDVQNRIAEREAQRRTSDILTKARGLLALQAFDEAVEILEDLARQAPTSEQVRAALELARQERQEYDRKRFVQSELEAARSEIKSNQFDAAIARLEPLASQSPGQNDVTSLLAYARGELEALRHMAKIRAAAQGAWNLLKAQKFDQAMTHVDGALRTFPDDPALLRLRQSIIKERAEYERTRFVQKTLADCAELEGKGRVEQACGVLEKALQRYKSESALADALALSRQKLVQQREQERAAALERDLRQADTFIAQGQFPQATQLLTQMQASYPGESQVLSLLSRLQERVQDDERRRADLKALRAEAQRFLDADQPEKTCEIVARGLKEYGADPKLTALGTSAERMRDLKDRAEKERRQFVQQTLADGAELERKGRVEQACAALEKALQRYKSESALVEALARLRQKLVQQQELERAAALDRDLRKADTFIAQGQVRQAVQLLTQMQAAYHGESQVLSLLNRVQERIREEERRSAALEALRADAQRFLDAGQPEKTCEIVARGLKEYGADPKLTALETAAQKMRDLKDRAEKERLQFVQQTLADGAELERKGRMEQACATLEKALQRYQSESALLDALARLRQKVVQQQEQERAAVLERDLRQADTFIAQGQVRQAVQLLTQMQASYPGESQVLSFLIRVQEEERRRAALDALRTEAQRFLDAEQPEKTCEVVARGVREFGTDPKLIALGAAAERMRDLKRAETERAQFIEQTLADCAELERKGRVEQACATLEKALERYQSESALLDALARLRQKLVQQQEQERAAALDRELRQADTLIMQGQLRQAVQLLSQTQASYPGEPRVLSLLNHIQEEERRRADLEALRAEAQRLLDAGQIDKACEIVARGRKQFATDPRLLALEAAAEGMRVRRDALEGARVAFRERNWRVAAASLEAILRQDGKDAEARRLLDQVLERERAELRRNRIESGRVEAEKLMRSLQFQEAARRLRALHEEFQDDQAIGDDLSRALEAIDRQIRREAYTQGRNRAEAYLKTGQFQAAVSTLEELAGQYPDDAILKEELNAAREARFEHSRRERYASGRRQVAERVQARKFEEAIALLEALLVDFPGDSALQEDLRSAQGARELQEQRERLDREVAQLEKLYRKGDARAVRERASALPADLQDARVRELLAWAAAEMERSRQESEREPAESLRRKRNRRNAIGAAIVLFGVLAGVPIAYMLRPRPIPEKLTVDHGQLTFIFGKGAAVSSQTLKIGGMGAGGHGGVHWSATTSDDWLSVNPNSGTTQEQTTVSVDPHLLSPGPHSGYVLLTSEDGATSAHTSVKVVIPVSAGSGPSAAASPAEGKPAELHKPADKPSDMPTDKPTGKPIDKPMDKPAVSPKKPDSQGSVTAATPAGSQSHSGVDSEPARQPNQLAQPTPVPPRAVDCGPGYQLPKSGRLTWMSSGVLLEKGAVLVIGGADQSLIGGQIRGELPGCQVNLEPVTDGIVIVDRPSPADGFRRVMLRNSSSSPVPSIELRWKIK